MKLVPLDYTQEEMASTGGSFKMPETLEDIRKFPIPWTLVTSCGLLLSALFPADASGAVGSRVSCCRQDHEAMGGKTRRRFVWHGRG